MLQAHAKAALFYALFLTGNVGELTMALSDLLWEDMVAGPETQRHCVSYDQ